MAKITSTGADAPGKRYSPSFPCDAPPPILAGLVQHQLLPASMQVQILSIVDATGGASIGDIVAELPGHPDPVGAVMALVAAGVLITELHGVLDANTMVHRPSTDPRADSFDNGTGRLPADPDMPDISSSVVPTLLEPLAGNPFSAAVIVGPGVARRDFAARRRCAVAASTCS